MSLGDEGERNRRVYQAVREHPGATYAQLARITHEPLASVKASLLRCCQRRIVIGVGRGERRVFTAAAGIDPATVYFGRGMAPGSAPNRKLGPLSPNTGKHLSERQIIRRAGTSAELALLNAAARKWDLL